MQAVRPHAVATRLRHAATALATGLALVACGTGAAPPTPPAPPSPAAPSAPAGTPSPAALEWAGTTCSQLQPIVDRLAAPPTPDLADVTGTRQAYLSYLDTARQLADQALQQLDAAGPPPVTNGDRIASQVRDQLTQMRTDITQAHSRLQQADPGNVISLGPAIAAATDVVGSLGNSTQALTTIRDDPELGPAFAQAPACASLRTVG
jgi:hypothetical protein